MWFCNILLRTLWIRDDIGFIIWMLFLKSISTQTILFIMKLSVNKIKNNVLFSEKFSNIKRYVSINFANMELRKKLSHTFFNNVLYNEKYI